jgi:hypothetical protein
VSEAHKQSKLIRVFPLAEPREWFSNADPILKVIVSAIKPDLPGFMTPQYTFNVDPVCGSLRYSLVTDLWHENPKRSPPPDAEAATRAATDFLARLQAACQEEEYLRLKIAPLLPNERFARIVPVGTTPVFHVAKPWVDHWLCRFEVYLRPFESNEEARVFGSAIDIRIGQGSKVTGLVSHWRPALLEQGRFVEMFQPEEEEEHDHDEDHAPTSLVYELAGENSPQNFLTPYYLSLEGHHGGMLPASSHSLLVAMSFAEKKDRAYVVPRISGGSGVYACNWAYWRPEALFEQGLVGLGEQEFIELPLGVYNVMLHVTDKRYGVVQTCETMAFIKGKLPESSASAVAPKTGADSLPPI